MSGPIAFDDRDAARLWKHVRKGGPGECWICDLKNMCLAVQIRGRAVSYSVRRLVWWMERGEELHRSVTLIATCGESYCCNPAHLQKVKKGTRQAQVNAPVERPKRRREPLYLMAWMAGFDLVMLPNGRYRVVRR